MLSINQLTESKKETRNISNRRSTFYESASLVISEKSLNLDYNEYQLKNFINSRTSGEGFKEAVKGGLQKIWKFIKGIFDAILKGLDNFWQTIKRIFSKKKKKDETKEKVNDELNATVKEKERLAKELERTKEQLRQAQQSNKTNANLKNENAVKINELERLQTRNEKRISILKNKLNTTNKDLDKARQDLKMEEEVSAFTRKAYHNYMDKIDEKYGVKSIERFLHDMKGIGVLISSATDHLVNALKHVTDPNENIESAVYTPMESFRSKMVEVQQRLENMTVDNVKEILSKNFYLTPGEIEFGTSLPRDAFSQPYEILRKSQARLTRVWKRREKEISQIIESGSDQLKDRIGVLEEFAKGMKTIMSEYNKYKRHLVSFAIAVEPILDEKAKGYFRGIR